MYEFVVRHFLASVSKDATGNETKVEIKIGSTPYMFHYIAETFTTRGLKVEDYGWLEVFKYEKWSDHELPEFKAGEAFVPTSLMMEESKTTPPKRLAEADLISKMDANGIGTDATIHEHIKTVQDRYGIIDIGRGYVMKKNNCFEPTGLGVALVECYENIGIPLYKPYLRAHMEADMKMVAEGQKTKVCARFLYDVGNCAHRLSERNEQNFWRSCGEEGENGEFLEPSTRQSNGGDERKS